MGYAAHNPGVTWHTLNTSYLVEDTLKAFQINSGMETTTEGYLSKEPNYV
jgi:hypothetical protein